MKQNIYSVIDRPTSEHSQPFVAENDELAFRVARGSFGPQSLFVLYPSDFAVVQLGTFDSETGVIEPHYKIVQEMKVLIPIGLRDCALDGTFTGGVTDGKET